MTYLIEFPDFDAAYLPPIPAGWRDESWHNDVCPNWHVPAAGAEPDYERPWLTVWVDYATPAVREFPENRRYIVMWQRPTMAYRDGDTVAETDDWDEAVRAAAQAIEEGVPA